VVNKPDQIRLEYGFWIVIAGFTVVLGIFITAIFKWNTASDIAAVVSSSTGVIGTIVGAYFGVQVGSAGRDKAESAREEAEDKVVRLVAALQPDIAEKILATK
jgi:uncharacterized protein YacL